VYHCNGGYRPWQFDMESDLLPPGGGRR
jgi:hypothetical protein